MATSITQPGLGVVGRMERWVERSILPYLDPLLVVFIAVVVWATYITRHGLQTFYGYLFDDPMLVKMITLVLVIGIPLLDVAFFLERRWWRWFYFAGMLVLLGMEVLAQYYQGQAAFTSSVSSHFPTSAGIDIATIAKQPHGRFLVVVFLVLPSGVVVGFGAAAANRIRQLRAGLASVCSECASAALSASRLAEDLRNQTVTSQRYLDAAKKKQQEAVDANTKVENLTAAIKRHLDDGLEQSREIERLKSSVGVITKATLVDYLTALERQGLDRKTIASRTGFSLNTVNGMMGKQGD